MEGLEEDLNKLQKLQKDLGDMVDKIKNLGSMDEGEKKEFLKTFIKAEKPFFDKYMIMIICVLIVLILFGKGF